MTHVPENEFAALRLYFPVSLKANPKRFWHHLSAPELSMHLLKVARHSSIKQVMMHTVQSGYLSGNRLSHHHPEVTGMTHPQCIELFDTEYKLREFIKEHAEELRKVHAVLLKCELPLMTGSCSPETVQIKKSGSSRVTL